MEVARDHAYSSHGKSVALPLFEVTVLWKCPFCYESCLLIKDSRKLTISNGRDINHLLIAVLNLEKISL